VQEDFTYHDMLVSSATHPHRSAPMAASSDLGDGLNTLSRYAFTGFTRTKWSKCNGLVDQSNDCLTPKGFSRFVLDLGGGRLIDVYNAHFDAGRSSGDVVARNAQVDQLLAAIAQTSAGHAVIVAGDTNMKVTDEPTFQKLLAGASLECACRKLSCPEPERIDRVLFRSSATLALTAKNVVVESFVDASGKPLSDHEPVSATFEAN
jgi:endonuclease/exonuclease/phosphatase family metal-dependent hydrolase